MKYEVILQDNKKIVLTKEEADIITKELFNTAKDRQEAFKVGENVFKRSAVKGIFPLQEDVYDNKETWLRENRAWDATCLKMSKYSIQDKVTTELTNRILPGITLSKIAMNDQQIAVMESNIRQFFEDNPKYPRCPMRIWWPFVSEFIVAKTKEDRKHPNIKVLMGKWWEIVSRNDGAISEWLKYQ